MKLYQPLSLRGNDYIGDAGVNGEPRQAVVTPRPCALPGVVREELFKAVVGTHRIENNADGHEIEDIGLPNLCKIRLRSEGRQERLLVHGGTWVVSWGLRSRS